MTVGAQTRLTHATEADLAERLLKSSAMASYDPATEIDWDAPLPDGEYGTPPEWCSLYGTPLWDEMTESQRVTLSRHEAASMLCTGIWFEMILQQMILRDQYVKDPATPEFRFALTEIADECRHSIMFARICEKFGTPAYYPKRIVVELARYFKSTANYEVAYGAGLVAEEVLDVLQRDTMNHPDVLDIVRVSSKIHVVEESRHMKFARAEVREHLRGACRPRRWHASLMIAIVGYVIVTNLVNERVYEAAGLDTKHAVATARTNQHHKSIMRNACSGLMEFLGEEGLLTPPAIKLYQRANMI
ncbi:MAG: diiron oxygenase [Nocardiopsaceae bacterium]|nr:diiron oxygenase [Nocardiopsaceae bacterium]